MSDAGSGSIPDRDAGSGRGGTSGAPRLVLASRSPRRAEILRRLGLAFEVDPAGIDETLRPREAAREAAERLAREKAEAAAREGALVLAADTIVALGDEILEKPGSPGEAVSMLRRLSGREHLVCTGVAVATPERTEAAVEVTRVRFRRLSDAELREYAATGEPLDKAGGYGIQARGAALVEGIEGDFFAVMGLPVVRLLEVLERFGWRYAYGELRRAGSRGP